MKKFAIGLLAFVSVAAMAQNRVAKFDKNGDAKVDFAELSTSCKISKGLFEKADKNGDGVLSEAEMRTAKEYLFSNCTEEKNA